MQSVETPHDRKVGFRHRARQVVHTATADAQDFRLPRDGQVVLAVDHRLALSKPALLSAPSLVQGVKRGVRGLLREMGYDIHRTLSDTRYSKASHDTARALPPGAQAILRRTHPRLQELRAAYAAVDLPMAQRTRWDGDYLDRELDLTSFRGDNAFVWQFRNLGAEARLKYYFYLRDLASRDQRRLIETLGEDGAFGCWIFEYPGWPPVSRDLLDSVNELYFLQRHLGFLERAGWRVPAPAMGGLRTARCARCRH